MDAVSLFGRHPPLPPPAWRQLGDVADQAAKYTEDQAGWVQMCPGGPRWRDVEGGLIEIEGQGVPQALSTGKWQDATFIKPVLEKYGEKIALFSDKVGVDPDWTTAIMIVESRGVNTPKNAAGAGGIMALLQTTINQFLKRKGDVNNIDESLEAGTKLLRYLSDLYHRQLPAIAAGYNAGKAYCSATSQCHTMDTGGWVKDGSTFPNSMGFVEDCTSHNGKQSGSQYSLRAVSLNNTLKGLGYFKNRPAPPSGGDDASSPGMSAGMAVAAGIGIAALGAGGLWWVTRSRSGR
jgi:hypothetical protein